MRERRYDFTTKVSDLRHPKVFLPGFFSTHTIGIPLPYSFKRPKEHRHMPTQRRLHLRDSKSRKDVNKKGVNAKEHGLWNGKK